MLKNLLIKTKNNK
jgi:hypothetical protein